jgi:RNA 3'-terminal phosphate cyclase (ATP)
MKSHTVEIDGSHGEGGGQILRTSLTLALLTGKPFHLRSIRAGRSRPGLQPQHLMCVRAAAAISQAQVAGDKQGSTDLHFTPGPVTAGSYHFPIGTAGASSLVLQTIVLPLALRGELPSDITVTGGTHVKASPSFHFLDVTWRVYCEWLGLNVQLRLVQAGFYPRGGGVVTARIEPAARVQRFRSGSEERPENLRVTGHAGVAGLPGAIADRMVQQATKRLQRQRIPAELGVEVWPGGVGAGLVLVLHSPPVPTVFYGLGERGKPAERVADEAVDELLTQVAADAYAVDAHSADQLVLPLALADGPSEFPVAMVTQHLLTNIEVIRRFVDREIRCEEAVGEKRRVEVH